MKTIKFIPLVLTIFALTGCAIPTPYMDGKFGEKAVDAWFSYKNGEDDLGQTRKKLENIQTIEKTTCKYLENDFHNRYVYSCEISYKPIGETVIPLSQNETINVYAIFIPKKDGTFTYRVYSSDSKEGIWKEDPDLNYGK